MFAQRVTITYRDGTTATTTLTQWSMSQFAVHAQAKGWTIDLANPGLLGVTMLRYQAWCELHRDPNTPRPAFDAWDGTVDDVEPAEAPAPVDPTQPAT
jgi:hypothetical protein